MHLTGSRTPRAGSRLAKAIMLAGGIVAHGTILDAGVAGAQAPPVSDAIERPIDRDSVEPLPAPAREAATPFVLPPIPPPSLDEIQGDAPDAALLVDEIAFEGNTVLSTAELEATVAPYLGRRLAAEGIEALRRQITRAYYDRGYVNSGAVIPAQDVSSGRLRIEIIEGHLEAIRISGLAHYRESVLVDRIEREIERPLRVADVERAIQLLDQDHRIERINGRLRPGSARSAAILELTIKERSPLRVSAGFDNWEAPSIGSYAGRVFLANDNILGLGDNIGLRLTKTEGLTRFATDYAIPVSRFGTKLFAEMSFGWAELIDNELEKLGVESKDTNFRVGVRQTLWHTPSDLIEIAGALEYRRSLTELGNRGFSFVPGPDNGRSEVTALRLVGDWTHRGLDSVIALRSITSFGQTWFGATHNDGRVPDSRFIAWYGQARAIHRFPTSGIDLIFRSDMQFTNSPLLALEQFSIGGPNNVRGFRRNQLVRDQGIATAFEIDFPLLRGADAQRVLTLSPFFDVGYAWNPDRDTPGRRELTSLGLGLTFRPRPSWEFGVEWAHGFQDTGKTKNLQDESVYLRAVWRPF